MTTPAVDKPKPARRSQFIERLHDLLENPHDSEALRWTADGTSFEITSNETKARAALAPKWDFRSLSSFIRQLSYYDFKRLSDRRRSSERRASATGWITFCHPSGLFVRGDPSQLAGITRKARNRPEKTRKNSAISNGSGDEAAMGDWNGASVNPHQSQAGPSSLAGSNPYAYTSSLGQQPQYHPPTVPPSANEYGGQWRSLDSPNWHPQQLPPPSQPGGPQESPRYGFAAAPHLGGYDSTNHALRRSSLSDFKVAVSPRTRVEELHPDPATATGYRHVPSPFAALNASTVEGHGPSFSAPYPTPTYPPASNLEQPQYGATSEGGAQEQPYRATGLPMFTPRGSISGEAGGQQSTYASYPLTSKLPPPVLSSLHPPHDFSHPRIPSDVLPSPTYSTDDDRPSPLYHDQSHNPFLHPSTLPPQPQQHRTMYASSSPYAPQQYNNPHALSTFNPSSSQPHSYPQPHPHPHSQPHPHPSHALSQALDEAAPHPPPPPGTFLPPPFTTSALIPKASPHNSPAVLHHPAPIRSANLPGVAMGWAPPALGSNGANGNNGGGGGGGGRGGSATWEGQGQTQGQKAQ